MEKPDCRKCGACCVSPYDEGTFCDITKEDLKRLTARDRKHLRSDSHTPFEELERLLLYPGNEVLAGTETRCMRQRSGPLKDVEVCGCYFLSGSVMHKVRCRIYDRRPSICRSSIEPGDPLCLEIRRNMDVAIRDLKEEEEHEKARNA